MKLEYAKYRKFEDMPTEVRQSVAKMGFADGGGHLRDLYHHGNDKRCGKAGGLINSIILYLDGKIIGWAAKYYNYESPFASVWVQRKYRGKGYGKILMGIARTTFCRRPTASTGWLKR